MFATIGLLLGGGFVSLIGLAFGYQAYLIAKALTTYRDDADNLRHMLHSMSQGLYLKEALEEFKPEVRKRLRALYIPSSLLG